MPRDDPSGSRLTVPFREPRVVVGIIFEVGSIYLTNKTALINVPGNVVHGTLQECASISHELNPNEARSTIGSFNFSAVDLEAALTDELRDQLFNEGEGPRHNEVRVFTGDTDNFADGTWRRVATYVLDGVIANDTGLYQFTASDQQREIRTEIFQPKTTRLTESIDESVTTLNVISTEGFERIEHNSYFTADKLQTVGYVLIKKTREIISWRAKTDTSFTGCERAFNSVASQVDVTGTDQDQWPEVIEFPYLESDGPMLAYALLTGSLYGVTTPLPEHWHCGIPESKVDFASFANIGDDLHEAVDISGNFGLIMRFIHLAKTDAKRFIEEEILLPMGCYLAITPEGVLTLKRVTTVLSDASWVHHITAADVVEHGPLQHDQEAVINELTVDFNWDGDTYTRRKVYFNEGSIAAHDPAPNRTVSFKGLPVTQHSAVAIRNMWRGLSSRYGAPPHRLSLRVLPHLNFLEVGDVVKVTLDDLEDYAGTGTFERSMEVQQISMNWITGELSLELFGSSVYVPPDAPANVDTILPDAWFVSEGTNLGDQAGVSGGVLDADLSLGGADDMRDNAAIWYYGGNFTINSTRTLTLSQNVQLRILGTLVINGTITTAGNGVAAVTDPHTVNQPYVFQPHEDVSPKLGSTRGSAGLEVNTSPSPDVISPVEGPMRTGLPAIPDNFDLIVEGGVLLGVPADLRGAPGIYGQPIVEAAAGVRTVKKLGSAGGAGGGGLMIVCRALQFGVNGAINVSGANGAAPTTLSFAGRTMYPGAGGGGAPGGVLVVIDDIDPLLPDLADNVTADHGSTQQTGNPTGVIYSGGAGDPGDPITGQGPGIGVGDHALSHSTVVFLEPEIGLGEGADELPPRPTFLSYTPNDFGIEVQLAELPELAYDKVQIYGSIDNDRHNATQMFSGRGSLIQIPFDNIRTRWLWARTIQGARESEWSSDADDGFQTTGGAPYREFTTWLETFDAYSSREDFEREWEILSGDPTISFSPVGINGSNVLHVQGAMYAMHRRPVPYDYTKLYECSTRFRAATHEAGNESLSVGFLGETATTLVDSQGNSGTFAPTNAVLNACDLANFPDWQRAIGWITGSEQVLLSALPLHLPLNYLISPWRPSHIHSLNGVTPERCSYIRPTLMCNFPAGTTATCQIDYVEVRRVDSDIGIGELADGNFAAADDHEYWAQVGFAWDAQLAVGAGLAGGNAILFDVDGTVPNNQIAIISRNAMTMTNNITVAVQYIIENAVSIGSQVRLTLAAVPLVLSGEMPRHYEPGAGTAPTANVLINTLDDSGNVAQTTLSISNIFANSTLQAADYFHLWIMIELPEASDDFDFYMVRARIARS